MTILNFRQFPHHNIQPIQTLFKNLRRIPSKTKNLNRELDRWSLIFSLDKCRLQLFGKDINYHTLFYGKLVIVGKQLLDVFVQNGKVDADLVIQQWWHEDLHHELVFVAGVGAVDAVDGHLRKTDWVRLVHLVLLTVRNLVW